VAAIMRIVAVAISLSLNMVAPCFAQAAVDYGSWDVLLRTYVKDGQVDYRAIQASRSPLDRYLAVVAAARMDSSVSPSERLAFWINAYNANVVRGVLDHYPVASVKKVPGFFDKIRYPVAGSELTLNQMEHQARMLGDPRVHFALVCASSSCPVLRSEAYVPERVEAQLQDQAVQFLGDTSRGMRIEGSALLVSKIFEWYKADFVPASELGWLGRLTPQKLLPRIEPYLSRRTAEAIRSRQLALAFLDYDWLLNERTGDRGEK